MHIMIVTCILTWLTWLTNINLTVKKGIFPTPLQIFLALLKSVIAAKKCDAARIEPAGEPVKPLVRDVGIAHDNEG